MKRYRLYISIVLIAFLSNISFGQNTQFGVTASGGVSRLSSEIGRQNKVLPSGQFGIFYKNRFNQNWAIRVGLHFNYLQSRNAIKVQSFRLSDFIASGGSIGNGLNGGSNVTVDPVLAGIGSTTSFFDSKNELGYASIPISLEYKWGRFGLHAGVQSMWLSFAGEYENGRYRNLDGLPSFDIGPIVGGEFWLSNHFSFRLNVYHGATNVAGRESALKRKNRQYMLGVNYYLTKEN